MFSATAIVPEPPRDSPENNLLQLASSYESSVSNTDSNGNQIQLTNTVWDVRSFDQQQDLYYVLQEVDYYWSGASFILWGGNASTQLSVASSVIQTSPASTHCTTSTTSGVSFTGGAGIGWNETQGLNAALTGGVSIDNSQTITCPPIFIENQTDPGSGEPAWAYIVPFPPSFPQLQTFYNQWIWRVPFANYSPGQSTVQVSSNASLCYDDPSCPNLTASLQSTIPMPFGDVFALEQPVVLSVTPTCANAGTTFTIAGTGMYPSLVKSVLIDGSPLDPSQYTTASDTAINVVAPRVSGEFLPVVVQTSQGNSNDTVTIEISVIDFCNL